MKVKYTFLVLIAFFTLAWKLQGVNCENEEPLELHDCLNDGVVCVRVHGNKSMIDSVGNGGIMQSLEVPDQRNCVVECYTTEGCVAAEVSTHTGSGKHECFLLNTRAAPVSHNGHNSFGIQKGISCGWEKVDIPYIMYWISVMQAGIWGLYKPLGADAARVLYVENSRNGNRPQTFTWQPITQTMEQLSVGDNMVAAVDIYSDIYFLNGLSDKNPTGFGWRGVPGVLVQVSAKEETGTVWGVNGGNMVYEYQGSDWVQQDGQLKYVSAGVTGVWGINPDNQMLYRHYSQSTFNTIIGGGTFKQVAAEGSELVVAVDLDGILYHRTGITVNNPSGDGWEEIEFSPRDVKQASVYRNELWVTLNNGELWKTHLY